MKGEERERKRTWRDHEGTRKWRKEGYLRGAERKDAGLGKEADPSEWSTTKRYRKAKTISRLDEK